MDVDIKGREPETEIGDPGFLGRLEQGDPRQVGLPVGMASWLQPATQLCVQDQQHQCPVLVDHECRAREMARSDGAMGEIGLSRKRGEDPLPGAFHGWVTSSHGPDHPLGDLQIRRTGQGG
jgi:hypothetical protein